MVTVRTGPLQGKPCLKQCVRPSLQRAPVSRRRVVALAVPSVEDRQAPEQREEHNSSNAYVDANRTAEAVRSFDDAAQSRGPSLQSAADLVRLSFAYPIMEGAATSCGDIFTVVQSFWTAESLLGFSTTRGCLNEQACLTHGMQEAMKTRVDARQKSRMYVLDRCKRHSIMLLEGIFLRMQVGDLWRTYCRKIETDPIKAKAVTSFLGFMIGDSIAQKIEGHTFNPVRCGARPRSGQDCLLVLISHEIPIQRGIPLSCSHHFSIRRRLEICLSSTAMHAGPCA